MEIFKTYGMYSLYEIAEVEKAELEFLKEIGEETNQDLTDRIYGNIDVEYEDEQCNLNKELDGRVLAIVSVGRWNGRKSGYKILSRNLNSILDNIGCDEFRVYADKYNVKADGYHHDGHNFVEYRELREDRNYQNLLDKLYSGVEVSRQEINYYTKSLRSKIKEVYGC